MAIKKSDRIKVYEKYKGHCAYCGKELKIKEMQVDHITPKDMRGIDDMSNYNPSCRRCNFYKSTFPIYMFRKNIQTIQDRIRKIFIVKIAEDYGIIEFKPFDGKFYFEKEVE